MSGVISFEERAVATLREKLGEAENARRKLIAFADGHCNATAAIHDAVTNLMMCRDIEDVGMVVTRDWPLLLRVDAVAMALVVDGQAFRFDVSGIHPLERAWVEKAAMRADPVEITGGTHGSPLFGAISRALQSQAIIHIPAVSPGMPEGVLLLGQTDATPVSSSEGDQLLAFLGRSLSAMLARWVGANT